MKQSYISWESLSEEDCYLISYLWVNPAERRQGKATQLLRNAIEEMRAEGKHSLVKLSVDSDSVDPENSIDASDLVEFYENEGFSLDYASEVIIMSMDI